MASAQENLSASRPAGDGNWTGTAEYAAVLAAAGREPAREPSRAPQAVPELSRPPADVFWYQVKVRPLNGGPQALAHTSLMSLERARQEARAWGPGRARVVEVLEVDW